MMDEAEWIVETRSSTAEDADWRPLPNVEPRTFEGCKADLHDRAAMARARGVMFRLLNVRTQETVNWLIGD